MATGAMCARVGKSSSHAGDMSIIEAMLMSKVHELLLLRAINMRKRGFKPYIALLVSFVTGSGALR